MNDRKHLIKLKNGDIDAMNTLLENIYPKLYKFVFSLCKQKDIANDIVQETCIRFMNNLDHYEEKQKIESYFCKIAINITRDYYRKQQQHQEVFYEEEQYIDGFADPSYIWKKKIKQEEMLALLEELPLIQKEVLLLRYYYHFKIEEIAKMYQTSPSTIKSRIKLGLAKIRKKIEVNKHEE